MGKTAVRTVVYKSIIDNFHTEEKEKLAVQSATSKPISGKLIGRENCGGKRCTSNMGGLSPDRRHQERARAVTVLMSNHS